MARSSRSREGARRDGAGENRRHAPQGAAKASGATEPEATDGTFPVEPKALVDLPPVLWKPEAFVEDACAAGADEHVHDEAEADDRVVKVRAHARFGREN